jgi:hypothetical protein
MNPKAAEAWNFALAKMESARQHLEKGEDGPAKTEIAKAVYIGAGALYYLRGSGPQEQAAYQAAQSFINDMAAGDHSASEIFTAARNILNYMAGLSPPDDSLPTL